MNIKRREKRSYVPATPLGWSIHVPALSIKRGPGCTTKKLKRPLAVSFLGRHMIHSVLSIAVIVVVLFVVLPRIADMSAVWETLTAMTWLEVATLTLAAGWNLVTYWVLLITALPGLTLTQAMIVTEASTAVTNSIPGGQAVAWGGIPDVCIVGFRRRAIALALLVSGVADLFAKLGMPVIALFFLTY
jgi:putative heme transporter